MFSVKHRTFFKGIVLRQTSPFFLIALFAVKHCLSKTDVCRKTMFDAKHFVKHFCLSLGNTGLLTYENNHSGSKIFRQTANPAIAGFLPE